MNVDEVFRAAILDHQAGRFKAARAGYLRVLEASPQHVDALQVLGALCGQEGRYEEAEKYVRAALALLNHPVIHGNLGLILQMSGRLTEAEISYRNALEIKPDYVQVHERLAYLLHDQGRLAEAEAAFGTTWRLNPSNTRVLGKLYHLRRTLCRWDHLNEYETALQQVVRGPAPCDLVPFDCLSSISLTPSDLRKAGAAFAESQYGPSLALPPLHKSSPENRTQLRIGYLSADFREHAVACLIAGVFERHDKKNFSITLYSYGPDANDAVRRRIKASCEVFRDVQGMSDEAAARQIASDEIDILVDLMGYTTGARLGILALRPAPLIASWIGFPGSLGHPRLANYIISDPIVTPPKHAHHFSETLALLPHCYQPNDREQIINTCPARKAAGLPETGFVFCSFNQTSKIHPATFSIWCRLLIAVPQSVLWLVDRTATATVNLRREAEMRGVESTRLIFAPVLPYADHLGRLQLADLALDTFPYASHATGSNALWAGVPMVTKIGETFASRVGASLLTAVGLPELVTSSDEDYFTLALSLARHPDRLAGIREKLAAQRMTCPLFDTERFTRNLELLYRRIWSQHVAGGKESVVIVENNES